MIDELKIAKKWLAEGAAINLAIVTETWGSAPRAVGSIMVVHENGHFEGSVSGGCVEGSVIAEANALTTASPVKELTFDVSMEQAWQAGLACGGKIKVTIFHVTPDHHTIFEECLHIVLTERQRYTLCLSKPDAVISRSMFEVYPAASETAASLELTIHPPLKLIIIGAVHIAQELSPMAKGCGYDVTIIDPRNLFTSDRTFTSATLVEDWPDEYFAKNSLDRECALVTLTHDPKIDDAALIPALKSDVFYIGSLGSRKTHASRIERLSNTFDANTLERIHGPAGIAISAKNPAEIAVSIMAEITAIRWNTHAL